MCGDLGVSCLWLTLNSLCPPVSPVLLTSDKSLTIPRDYQLTTLVLTNNATVNKVFSPLTFACFQVTKIELKPFQTDLSWQLIPGTVYHFYPSTLQPSLGLFRPMIGRPMSVNSSFDSHGSHNPNFPRDSSFDSRYRIILPSISLFYKIFGSRGEKSKVFQKYYIIHIIVIAPQHVFTTLGKL